MIKLHTNKGTIEIELDKEKAPNTCENFLNYVKNGQYDNTIFHRVIPGFMIQGGGFTDDMQQKPTGSPIDNEADNGLENLTGTLAMARTGDPHSATCQFFINVNDNSFLNHTGKTQDGWGYCVFAKVTAGMDIVMAISMETTGNVGGHGDVPVEAITITSVEHSE